MNTPEEKKLSESLLAACKAAGIEKPKYIAQDGERVKQVWHWENIPTKGKDIFFDESGSGTRLDHPPYADDWQESLLEFRDYALIRKCNKCQSVTAIDLIGNDGNEKELQYDGETVFRVSKEAAHGAVVNLCKCTCKPQGEPLADVLARHPESVAYDGEVIDACKIAYRKRLNDDTMPSSNANIYQQAWSDALAWAQTEKGVEKL